MTNRQRTAQSRKSKKSSSSTQNRKRSRSARGAEYYHIEVLPKADFVTFQTQEVGRRGHIQRVAGQRSSGYWSTVTWLIAKDYAHIQDNRLVPDTKEARHVIEQLGSEPVRMFGDLFKARPRANLHEQEGLTFLHARARRENGKKAQSTRRKS